MARVCRLAPMVSAGYRTPAPIVVMAGESKGMAPIGVGSTIGELSGAAAI